MKRSIAFTSVFGLFLLGVVVGALAMHLVYATRFPPGPPHGPGRPGASGPEFLERLERRLDLTPEQKDEIRAILVDSVGEAEGMRREMEPRVREHAERVGERIREVLTPEQRRRFDEMRRHQRGRTDRLFLGRP